MEPQSGIGFFVKFCMVLLITPIFQLVTFVSQRNNHKKIHANFDEKRLITLHGTVIVVFLLHIIYCLKELKNTRENTYLACNNNLVQYYETKNFRNI